MSILRRLALSFALALGISAALVAPARAGVLSDNCNTIEDDGTGHPNKVCLAVTWHRIGSDGDGINVDRMQTSINTNGPWSSPVAVDCTSLLIYRGSTADNRVLKWKKTGNACDVDTYPGNHEYAPDLAMSEANCVWVQWNGNANIAGARDKDFTISVKFCR